MQALLSFFRRLTLVPQGITVVVAAFLPIIAIVSMFPAVPSLIDHFAADPDAKWKVPLMVSAPGLTIALLAPFVGYFVDRFGRRPLLLAATALYGVVGTAPFFLENLDLIFASRFALGATEAVILTCVNTLIGDYWDDTGRRDWLFLQGLLGPFLASASIFLIGQVTAVRWNGAFLIYLVAVPICVAMYVFLHEPKKDGATIAELAKNPGAVGPFPWGSVALIGATTLMASAIYYVWIINGGLAAREVGIISSAELGNRTAIPSLFVMAGSLAFWLLGGKPNAVRIAAFFLVLGGGLAGIGLATGASAMVIALIVQQTGAGMAVPALIAWAQTKLPFEHRGRGMGIWSGCFFFGQFSSPWFVHQLNDATGTMQGAFVVMGLISIVCGVVALLSLARPSQTLTPSETGL